MFRSNLPPSVRVANRNRLSLSQFGTIAGLYYGARGAYYLYKNRQNIKKALKYAVHSIPVAVSMYAKKRKYGPHPLSIKRQKVVQSAPVVSYTPGWGKRVKNGMHWALPQVRAAPPSKAPVFRYARTVGRRVRGPSGKGVGRGKRMYRKKRMTKKNKLYVTKKSIARDCYYKGCVVRQERGGTVTDNFCLLFGHTLPFLQMRRAFFMACIKKVFDKAGISMESPDTVINVLSPGDQVIMYYRPRILGSVTPALSTLVYTTVAADTLASITTAVIALYETAAVAGTYEDLQWESILYYGSGALNDTSSVRVSLIGASASYFFASTLKLQNRTSDGATNTQTDDLVAQHVVGKYYSGYGNYTENRARLSNGGSFQVNVIGDSIGKINVPSTTNTDYQMKEPAPQSQFPMVNSSGPVKFSPGELKKSYLKYECTMPINEFFKHLVRRWDATGPQNNLLSFPIKKTKFRFFMLEKEIETIDTASPATPITFGWELNHTIGCVINPHNNTYLSRENWINTGVPNA